MSSLLPSEAIARFIQNESRFDKLANGTASLTWQTSDGRTLPSLSKFLADKDAEINTAANSILSQTTTKSNAVKAMTDRFITPKASDPTVRDDTTALQTGDIYFNTTANQVRIRTAAGAWASIDAAIAMSSVTGLTTALAAKADTTAVNTALAAKADTTTVNTALAAKADTTTVNTVLAAKADTTTVNTALAAKADTTAVNTALAAKADASAVGIKSATALATTSGTQADFGSIPATAKRVTVVLDRVSLSATANLLLQLGTSAGVVNTGYSAYGAQAGSSTISGAAFTAGLGVSVGNAARLVSGIITLINIAGNVWVMTAVLGDGSSTTGFFSAGTISLPGVLDRVRLTSSGADTFDNGQVNVLWEL